MDFYNGLFEPPLLLHNNYGKPEEMPIEVFFRDQNDFSELERYALQMCQGRVLDVGAGVGAHSIVLQSMVKEVVAIEQSAVACAIMSLRGVKEVLQKNIFEYHPKAKYDSILMLMNGTGIVGTISNFKSSLKKLGKLLATNGQIIIDSSDISYLYKNVPPPDHYFGAVSYQYEYKRQRGPWFPWLYLDQKMLKKLSKEAGFTAQIIYEGNEDDYLAVIKKN